ncbi:MAG TPA: sialidase family protein [Kofleriaceae bacterium]|nr:sialidase family protein [Kofleriaceae bacterium]
MVRRYLLAFCVLLASLLMGLMGPDASANGRSPGTSTINFRRGMEQEIIAGLTFGLVVSRDGGATWYWVCEDAIGYGGTYDPDYVFTTSGALFATTFDGMKVQRDGCSFGEPINTTFVSTIAQSPDGKLYYGAAERSGATVGDSKIYRSTDDGMTWTASANQPGVPDDWWQSLEVAPSDANRLYLAGYRFVLVGSEMKKIFLLFRSEDGGQTWSALPTAQFVTMPLSTIEIAGISPTNPDLVFARVKLEDNALSDAIYRSTDKGQSWTRVLGKGGAIAFVVRKNGELVAATQALGAVRSSDNGTTWIDIPGAPHINCLAENSAGELWACTQNYGTLGTPSDGYGIMKTTTLASWQPVMKYQEMKGPVACTGGSVQKERCDTELWCGLCMQLGCDPGPTHPECMITRDMPAGGGSDGGCCKVSGTPAPGAMLLVLGVGILLLRRPPRRRR